MLGKHKSKRSKIDTQKVSQDMNIAPLPDWVTTAVENYRFNQQLRAYVDAVERLDQRILTETQEDLLMKSWLELFIRL